MSPEAVPTTHPRYLSLMMREKIVAGVAAGVTSPHGLIAHGRGEALDYLLGERTHPFAHAAIAEAARRLLGAKHPVLSINGNVCALAAEEMVALAKACNARLEVNIFHTAPEREQAIRKMLISAGAQEVLMPSRTHALEHLDHNRRWVHPDGIWKADVVFVPLEDGDRCQALVRGSRQVITIDLNPLSRTAQTATVTIVDHLLRALPLLTAACENSPPPSASFDNAALLREAVTALRGGVG